MCGNEHRRRHCHLGLRICHGRSLHPEYPRRQPRLLCDQPPFFTCAALWCSAHQARASGAADVLARAPRKDWFFHGKFFHGKSFHSKPYAGQARRELPLQHGNARMEFVQHSF